MIYGRLMYQNARICLIYLDYFGSITKTLNNVLHLLIMLINQIISLI